jgi:hypothetical protein
VDTRDWVKPESILDLFDSQQQYVAFVLDYESVQRENDALKKDLADSE